MELTLPDPLASALDAFAAAVKLHGVLDAAVLGSGTVLAARWQHRISTDLDFFIDYDHFHSTIVANEKEIVASLAAAGAFTAVVLPERIQCVMNPGNVETGVHVAPSGMGPRTGRSDDVVGSWRVPAQTNAAILRGKIVGRMMRQARVTVRDVYDIIVADEYDPESLEEAMRGIPASVAQNAIAELDRISDAAKRIKPLISPSRPEVAAALVEQGSRVLRRFASVGSIKQGSRPGREP